MVRETTPADISDIAAHLGAALRHGGRGLALLGFGG